MAAHTQPSVIVIGSGLAGLSTAIYLLERGIKPIILESRSVVGGRTSSWDEQGMEVETGLHRYLGMYSEMPKLLKIAGLKLDNIIDWEDELEIRVGRDIQAVFGASPLHRPLETIQTALGNNNFLTHSEKLQVSAFMAQGLYEYATNPTRLDEQTVEEFAAARGISPRIMQRVLVTLAEGIFFLEPRIYSAYAFFGIIAPYWRTLAKLRVGAFSGGMSDVLAQPLADYITKQGGKIMTSMPVTAISHHKRRFTVQATTQMFDARAVILATSIGPAQDIIRQSFHDPWFDDMLQLQSVPSVTFQMELIRPALPVDRTTFGPTTALASFAEQSRTTFKNSAGRLSVILSPPQRFIHLSADAILPVVYAEADQLGIQLEGTVLDYRKVVIPDDFYLMAPGAERLRPAQATSIPGFFLAGDYTKQQYLTTMEGAVYSGKLATEKVHQFVKS